MANTKVTSHVIANDAITADQLATAAVTHAKLHATMDLSGKTVTLPAVAIPSASTATTQSASDSTTKVATTAYVTTAISNLVDSAPAALDTLNEIAAALGDDANYASTTTAAIAAKLPLAGGTLTGNLVLSGAPSSGLHPATKTYTDTADALKLNLSGGTLTGDLILNTTTALKIPVGTTGQRPSAATGQIRWNSTDGALEVYNGSAWTAVGTGSSNKVLDTFTGNNSTTTFALSVTPANEDAIMVFIDGAYQEKGDYVLTNNSLALGTAPLSGEKIAVHTTTAAVHDGTSGLNNQFTATNGQTAFTLTQDPLSENNTQVYINGVYQQKTDYTVVGTTLTFDTGLTVGDVVEVNMFTVATLGNTDTMSEGVSNLYHTTARVNAVLPNTGSLSEGSNLYHTTARARGAISVSGNALSYNSSTGVITSAYEESPSFTGSVDVAGNITVGTNDTILAENNIRFKSSGASYIDHNTVGQDFIFRTSASSALDTTALTIQHDGNLLIGGTNPAPVSNNVAGISLRAVNGEAQISVAGAAALYLNRKTNDGALAYFRKDGGTIGALATAGGDLIIGSHNTCLRFDDSADDILPTDDAGVVVTNTLSLGSSAARFKELWIGSSPLDDYEEGSFTATLKGGSTGTITHTAAAYTKIGNTVHCRIAFINANTTGYSGHLRVEGLPFPASNSNLRNVCTPAMYMIGAFTADYVIGLLESSTHVNFYAVKSANTWNTVSHDAGSGRYLEFNMTYSTNS